MSSKTEKSPSFNLTTSRNFTAWLAAQQVSLAFTTYQVGKVFWLGLKPDGSLEVFNRTFNRAMGMYSSQQTLYLSTLYQLWRFENLLAPGETHQGYDKAYMPQVAWTTGDVDIHDIAVDADERPVFVSTLFSCLATVSETHSIQPLWKPPFVSKLAAEDRCHLNGLAMENGQPHYVTAVSRSDVADGWRDRRRDGGVVVDVTSNDIVLEGLSMPHSPRVYQGKLWLLDSGNGYFGYADLKHGRFERVAFCPGYGRGLTFSGDYAIIGLSAPRSENRTFTGLGLDDELQRKGADARCGLHVVNLRTGDAEHWLRLEGVVRELYDVNVIADTVRPMAIGLQGDEIRHMLKLPPG